MKTTCNACGKEISTFVTAVKLGEKQAFCQECVANFLQVSLDRIVNLMWWAKNNGPNPGRAEYTVEFKSMPSSHARKTIEDILLKRGWRGEWLMSLFIVKEVE